MLPQGSAGPAGARIRQFLRRLRLRAVALVAAELALAWAAAVSLSLLVAAAAGRAGVGGGPAQTGFFALSFLAPLVYALAVLLPRLLPLRGEARAASWVDRHAGGHLSASLRGAVELSPPGVDAGRFSPGLAAAAVEQAAEGVDRLDPRALLSDRSARRAGLLALVAALPLAVGALWQPELMSASLAAFFQRPAEALRAALDLPDADDGVELSDIRLSLSYPAYLRRAPEVFENATGKIRAPLGTVVDIVARVETDAPTADLVVGDGAPVAAAVSGGRLTGRFTVGAPGKWRFILRDGPSAEPTRAYPIDVEVDAVPTVDLLGVDDGAELSAGDELGFAFKARDDHGLTELSVAAAWEGHESRRVLTAVDGEPDLFAGEGSWFPAEWDVPAGADVELWLEVKDNDTVSGPKVGTSRRVKVRIASDKQRHEKTLALKEALKEQLLGALGDQLVWGVERTEAKALDVVELERRKGAEGMEPVLASFRGLRDALTDDALEERSVIQALLATERDVITGWDELDAASAQYLAQAQAGRIPTRRAADRSMGVDEARARLVSALERAVLSMESFANLQRLEDILASGDRLRDAADELREMLADGKDMDLKELLSKVDDLESQLGDMARKMSELSDQSASWFQNPEQQTREMKSALDEIRELMKQGKTEEAKKALEEYLQQLQEMMDGLEEMKQGEFEDVQQQAQRDIGQVIDGLKQLEQDQSRLARDTQAISEAAMQRAGVGQDQLGRAMQELAERARKIEDGLRDAQAAAEASPVDPATERQLEESLENARTLQAALQAGDLFQSLKLAQDLDADTQWLRAQAEGGGPRDPNARQTFRKGAGQAATEAMPVRQSLEELARKVSEARRQGAGDAAGGADRQQAMGQEAGRIGEQLQGFSQESAYVPGEWGQKVGEAARAMRSAEEKMRSGALQGATEDQRAAESALRDVRQQMEATREALEQQQRGMAQGQGEGQQGMAQRPGGRADGQESNEDWGGRRNNQGNVRILQQGPQGEQYRKELMEGMKGDTPERYEQQNRAYYERLVK